MSLIPWKELETAATVSPTSSAEEKQNDDDDEDGSHADRVPEMSRAEA